MPDITPDFTGDANLNKEMEFNCTLQRSRIVSNSVSIKS